MGKHVHLYGLMVLYFGLVVHTYACAVPPAPNPTPKRHESNQGYPKVLPLGSSAATLMALKTPKTNIQIFTIRSVCGKKYHD